MTYEPEQVQSAISPNTSTAQEPGIFSDVELTKFWNCVSLLKHSDATLKILGKAISYDILATSEQHPPEFHSTDNGKWFNRHNFLRVSLHDYMTPLFVPDRFLDAIGALFGFTCSFLTQRGLKFSTRLFLEIFVTFLPTFCKSISITYRFCENTNRLSFPAHGSFNYTTSKKVTDLLDADLDKR